MSRKEKLIEHLRSRPKDFTFEETTTLLGFFGYTLLPAGKTGGSRVVFVHNDDYIRMHKPHPRNVLKMYQVDDLIFNTGRKGIALKNCLHYKEYTGSVEFSEEDGVFHGRVIGISPAISFEGDSVEALTMEGVSHEVCKCIISRNNEETDTAFTQAQDRATLESDPSGA